MSHANATPHAAPIYDYIIAGAGGAGLSLLHYLLASPILSNKQTHTSLPQFLNPLTIAYF